MTIIGDTTRRPLERNDYLDLAVSCTQQLNLLDAWICPVGEWSHPLGKRMTAHLHKRLTEKRAQVVADRKRYEALAGRAVWKIREPRPAATGSKRAPRKAKAEKAPATKREPGTCRCGATGPLYRLTGGADLHLVEAENGLYCRECGEKKVAWYLGRAKDKDAVTA